MPILKSEMRFRMISKIEVGRAEILQFLMIQAAEREGTLDQQKQTTIFYKINSVSGF